MTSPRMDRTISAPSGRVWDLLTDLARAPRIISAIDGVERLKDGDGFVVGTRWRETRTVFGRQATEETEVVEDAGADTS